MTGLIILAAGASNRLGQPKQNLIYNGQTLLQRAIETALASQCRPIVVVLGANRETIQPNLLQYDITMVFNHQWQSGMASSLQTGIATMPLHNLTGTVIMLCDQPFVTPGLIDHLLHQSTITGKPIIACRYNETIGVPAYFDRSLFSKLEELQGDEGARQIIKSYPKDVHIVEFSNGSIDIDTTEDYKKLKGE